MNTKTIEILCKLNNDFYQNQCASFSATRAMPWLGWERCAHLLKENHLQTPQDFSVFDLACGNLRFEAFLASEFSETNFHFHAVDDCDDLVPPMQNVTYQSFDVMRALLTGQDINEALAAPACDASVSFGFMHHVPTQNYRRQVLSALIGQTRPGGLVIVSFWQFLNNETLRAKAQITHKRAMQELQLPDLDANDYLLGWKDVAGTYRYCHSFSEEEINQLIQAVADKTTVVARFVADGRTNNLNAYLVLRVR